MKLKKILIIGCGLLLVCGLIVSCGCIRPHHHRIHTRHFSRGFMIRIDNQVKRLNLTESQKGNYNEIRERMKADLAHDMKEMRKFPDEISVYLDLEDADINEIVDALKEDIAGKPNIRMKYLDYFVELYNILDERQKDLLIKDIKKEIDRRHIGR